jgi:hypothetical protein
MKPTIVVVGLLPAQAHHVEKACKDFAKIRAVESRGDVPRIPMGDHCVLLVRFVRHLWSVRALQQFPRNKVHYCRGGVHELMHCVQGIVNGTATFGRHHN